MIFGNYGPLAREWCKKVHFFAKNIQENPLWNLECRRIDDVRGEFAKWLLSPSGQYCAYFHIYFMKMTRFPRKIYLKNCKFYIKTRFIRFCATFLTLRGIFVKYGVILGNTHPFDEFSWQFFTYNPSYKSK